MRTRLPGERARAGREEGVRLWREDGAARAVGELLRPQGVLCPSADGDRDGLRGPRAALPAD